MVSDLAPIRGNESLISLWISDTGVFDLDPVRGAPLMYLGATGAAIESLDTLRGMETLTDLHVGETRVTDIRVVKTLPNLDAFLFSPADVGVGLTDLRDKPSIRFLGLHSDVDRPVERVWRAAVFWRLFDRGEFAPFDVGSQ